MTKRKKRVCRGWGIDLPREGKLFWLLRDGHCWPTRREAIRAYNIRHNFSYTWARRLGLVKAKKLWVEV